MGYARILVVDDDPEIHLLLKSILTETGWNIDSAYDGLEGLARLEKASYDLVLTDVRMPGLDGLELLQRISKEHPRTRVVVMTAENTPETLVRAIRDKAFTYFSKPFSTSAVIDMVGRALQTPLVEDEIEVLSARPDWIALRLRCTLEIADRLTQFFRELKVELSEQDQGRIGTAFRELLMNAVEHGGRSDPDQKVEVAYIKLSQAMFYYIRDPGKGFSFENLPHAAVSSSPDDPFRHVGVREEAGMRPGGFGIFLTRKLADEVLYNEKGNEVLLVKYLPRQTQS
jgi:CheY-like chemotaxis protein